MSYEYHSKQQTQISCLKGMFLLSVECLVLSAYEKLKMNQCNMKKYNE